MFALLLRYMYNKCTIVFCVDLIMKPKKSLGISLDFDSHQDVFSQMWAEIMDDLKTKSALIDEFTLHLSNINSLYDEELYDSDCDVSRPDELFCEMLRDLLQMTYIMGDCWMPKKIQVHVAGDCYLADENMLDNLMQLVEYLPNKDRVLDLSLDLFDLEFSDEIEENTSNFFTGFTSLQRLFLRGNYIGAMRQGQLEFFISEHSSLTAIEIDMQYTTPALDLKLIMANDKLKNVTLLLNSLIPNFIKEPEEYLLELGSAISEHAALRSLTMKTAPGDTFTIDLDVFIIFLESLASNKHLQTLSCYLNVAPDAIKQPQIEAVKSYFLQHWHTGQVDIKVNEFAFSIDRVEHNKKRIPSPAFFTEPTSRPTKKPFAIEAAYHVTPSNK